MLGRKGRGTAMTQTKTVYILLTRSGTWFSRLIHLATADRYTHASIGLDGPEGPFYSFARLDPRFALPAGLVQERLDRRPLNQKAVPWCLCELEVSPQAYEHLRQQLSSMYAKREQYHYNLLGALGCYFHQPLRREHHYFCSQFVASLLEESGAAELGKCPGLVRPVDFCSLRGLRAMRQGVLTPSPA